MVTTRFYIFRFGVTFGLLIFLILLPLSIYFQPIKGYVVKTQQDTSLRAKSGILGYMVPDFKQLAQNILNDHVFKPEELDTYMNGHRYMSFYKKGAELFPQLFEMHYMEGICQWWMGDRSSAIDSLRQSLQLNPVFFWTYYNLGLLCLKNGQIDAAIVLLSQAKRIPPTITEKLLHDLQAFYSIWRYMPDPEGYINGHLQLASQQVTYLLLVASAIKDHHGADVHFDPDQWNPVFF